MKLGILGGSFNPVHHGHLTIATRAAERVGLDQVLLVPTAISPLKSRRGLTSGKHRLTMIRGAIRGNPLFRASGLEIRRGGVSYTVETLHAIRKKSPAKLYLILGTDAFRLLPQWKEAEEVRRMVSFLVVPRTGDRPTAQLPKHYIVDAPLLEISSTEIRERVRKGLSIRYLVPNDVERYIREKGLFR